MKTPKLGCGFKYSNLPKQIVIWVTEYKREKLTEETKPV
jgi:hypothetical protein